MMHATWNSRFDAPFEMLIEFFTHLVDVQMANWLERFSSHVLVHAIEISASEAAKNFYYDLHFRALPLQREPGRFVV